MKILLAAINAKYIHTNPAIYSLKASAKQYRENIHLAEFTINHYTEDILKGIYKEKPDFIGFSCYIWNISMVEELCAELHKVLPETKIWLGGPEVSYDAKEYLETTAYVDCIMIGEGEETFQEVLGHYIDHNIELEEIRAIAYRNGTEVRLTAPRLPVNFSMLPFPYEDVTSFENKIIYYETIRGCPYSCSYCLSSIDKHVRLRDVELVKKELDFFLNHKVRQVKFVDRTFNCNRKHTLAIWNYIKEHDNGITNFHFEISADILGEEELSLLNTMREGLVQLEIGVQSTNPKTIEAIHRQMNMAQLSTAVKQIQKGNNVHQHLDLIAGLPYENYDSFKNSFNDVYALRPDQLQLGFLKVLKGSGMHEACMDYGIVYKSKPPYEVLYTKWLTYDEVLILKIVEEMVEVYYNSGQFTYAIKYLEHFFKTPFDLYRLLGDYYEQKNLFGMNHARIRRYLILIDFMKDMDTRDSGNFDIQAFCSILMHDLFLREKLKSRPSFADDQEQYKEKYRNFFINVALVRKYFGDDAIDSKETSLKQYLHLEHYTIDVKHTAETGIVKPADEYIAYDYLHRNPLNSEARTLLVDLSAL